MTSTAQFSKTSCLPEDNPADYAGPGELPDGTDQRLVQRCALGDPAALHELVERYQQRLYRFLRPLLGCDEDAEETTLDVFLRVWQNAHRFEKRASVSTWLFRIASNAACDRLRRRQGQERAISVLSGRDAEILPGEGVNAEEIVLGRLEREERSQQLEQALQSLRVEDRLLLVLYYQEELSYAEIGQITCHAYPVLKMRLLRARRRLRSLMEAQTAQEAE